MTATCGCHVPQEYDAEVCSDCGQCMVHCDCDELEDDSLYDADELGLNPEDDYA